MAVIKLNKKIYDIIETRIDTNSQLQLYNILYDTETRDRFLNIFKTYSIKEEVKKSILYELYTIENNDWWENIAYNYYKDITVWWIIPLVNNIINPFEFPDPGNQIFILKPFYLNKLLDEVYEIGKI